MYVFYILTCVCILHILLQIIFLFILKKINKITFFYFFFPTSLNSPLFLSKWKDFISEFSFAGHVSWTVPFYKIYTKIIRNHEILFSKLRNEIKCFVTHDSWNKQNENIKIDYPRCDIITKKKKSKNTNRSILILKI